MNASPRKRIYESDPCSWTQSRAPRPRKSAPVKRSPRKTPRGRRSRARANTSRGKRLPERNILMTCGLGLEGAVGLGVSWACCSCRRQHRGVAFHVPAIRVPLW